MSSRWLLCVPAVLLLAGCAKFDPADRRLALQTEYALSNQQCLLRDGHIVATGDLVNYSGRSVGFAITIRFLDGVVDLGRPKTTAHPEPLANGDTWHWKLTLPIPRTPAEPRCSVVQVAIGNNVKRR